MRAAVPRAAPAPPQTGGAHFNAELGAWKKPLRAPPGNVTLSQRGRIWLAVVIYCAAVWSAGIWIWVDLYRGGA